MNRIRRVTRADRLPDVAAERIGWRRGMRRSIALPALLSLAIGASLASAAPVIDQYGLTGIWGDQTTSGQGIVFETYPQLVDGADTYVFGGWFTYAVESGDADHNRWYSIQGTATAGASSADVVVYETTGGSFGADQPTLTRAVGTASLAFESCTRGTFDYALDDGRSGVVDLTRTLANVECVESGAPVALASDFGYSGVWSDPQKRSQGVMLEVNPAAGYVFAGWFTYADGAGDDASSQRWFTAQAPYDVNATSMPLSIYQTVGGAFDAAQPQTRTNAVGSAVLTIEDCEHATLAYAFESGELRGSTGTLELGRAIAVPPTCRFATAQGERSQASDIIEAL